MFHFFFFSSLLLLSSPLDGFVFSNRPQTFCNIAKNEYLEEIKSSASMTRAGLNSALIRRKNPKKEEVRVSCVSHYRNKQPLPARSRLKRVAVSTAWGAYEHASSCVGSLATEDKTKRISKNEDMLNIHISLNGK